MRRLALGLFVVTGTLTPCHGNGKLTTNRIQNEYGVIDPDDPAVHEESCGDNDCPAGQPCAVACAAVNGEDATSSGQGCDPNDPSCAEECTGFCYERGPEPPDPCADIDCPSGWVCTSVGGAANGASSPSGGTRAAGCVEELGPCDDDNDCPAHACCSEPSADGATNRPGGSASPATTERFCAWRDLCAPTPPATSGPCAAGEICSTELICADLLCRPTSICHLRR